MTLSYMDIDSTKRKRIRASISYEHSTCSYGQPAIVLPDGGALGLFSWTALGYRVEKATRKELEALAKLGLTQ